MFSESLAEKGLSLDSSLQLPLTFHRINRVLIRSNVHRTFPPINSRIAEFFIFILDIIDPLSENEVFEMILV